MPDEKSELGKVPALVGGDDIDANRLILETKMSDKKPDFMVDLGKDNGVKRSESVTERKEVAGKLKDLGFKMFKIEGGIRLKREGVKISMMLDDSMGFSVEFAKEVKEKSGRLMGKLVERFTGNGINAFPMIVRTPKSETLLGEEAKDDYGVGIDDPKWNFIKGDNYLVLAYRWNFENKRLEPYRWSIVPKDKVSPDEKRKIIFNDRVYFK